MVINTVRTSALSLFTTDAATLTMMWQTVLLGMGMVFAVLAILWLILSVFKLIFAGKTPKAEKPAAKKVEAEAAPKSAPAAPVVTQSNDELIAVITAAVAAYRAEEGENAADGSFRVVSFTRVKSGRAWNSK